MKTTRVESPDTIFKHWTYTIGTYHYPAFGVAEREYVVRKLLKNGKSPANSVAAESIARELGQTRYRAWAYSTPFKTSFCQGDVFYRKDNPLEYLQIRAMAGANALEIAQGKLGEGPPIITTMSSMELVAHLRRG